MSGFYSGSSSGHDYFIYNFMLQTRCTSIDDAEKLRKGADDFLDRALNTDVALIFAPSQIALAAILSSAAKIGVNLDR